jgi:hypothetical protein
LDDTVLLLSLVIEMVSVVKRTKQLKDCGEIKCKEDSCRQDKPTTADEQRKPANPSNYLLQ